MQCLHRHARMTCCCAVEAEELPRHVCPNQRRNSCAVRPRVAHTAHAVLVRMACTRELGERRTHHGALQPWMGGGRCCTDLQSHTAYAPGRWRGEVTARLPEACWLCWFACLHGGWEPRVWLRLRLQVPAGLPVCTHDHSASGSALLVTPQMVIVDCPARNNSGVQTRASTRLQVHNMNCLHHVCGLIVVHVRTRALCPRP